MQAGAIAPGSNVLIIDDLIATGEYCIFAPAYLYSNASLTVAREQGGLPRLQAS